MKSLFNLILNWLFSESDDEFDFDVPTEFKRDEMYFSDEILSELEDNFDVGK